MPCYPLTNCSKEIFVSITGFNIRKVKKILVIPLFRNGKLLSETKQRDEDRYLQLLHKAFSEHQFFFSTSNDITLTQQRLAKLSMNQPQSPQQWERADHRFFWNHNVIVDLIACEADEWIVPFMSAFIEYRPDCDVEGTKFAILFVSRRSRYRQGCRFTKRGLDENGNAANFVETEQILLFPDGKVTSYVQIRGSIPFQWASPVLMKYDPVVYIRCVCGGLGDGHGIMVLSLFPYHLYHRRDLLLSVSTIIHTHTFVLS